MTIKKPDIKLVVDNTCNSQLKLLRQKQKQYIKNKLMLQEERKLVNKLLKEYEDVIIKTEEKINKLKRKDSYVKSRFREARDSRASRYKDPNQNGTFTR